MIRQTVIIRQDLSDGSPAPTTVARVVALCRLKNQQATPLQATPNQLGCAMTALPKDNATLASSYDS